METIRNYLESMFANLPGTPEVVKAKDALWEMMEDKYQELIDEGKSNNEAVGTVIAEFGNLNEIADELGLKQIVEEPEQFGRRRVSVDEAREYIRDRKTASILIGLGVVFCIMCVVPPIIAEAIGANDVMGAVGLFGMVAIGVVLFIVSSVLSGKWKFMDKEECTLDISATDYVVEEKKKYNLKHAIFVSIGVAFCILSVVPPMILSEISLGSDVSADELGGAGLFVFVAIGVFLIVVSTTRKHSYEYLLKLDNRVVANEEEIKYISPAAESFMSVYWTTVTCIYLCWSFLTFQFGMTWIIWPIAGILHSVLKACLTNR